MTEDYIKTLHLPQKLRLFRNGLPMTRGLMEDMIGEFMIGLNFMDLFSYRMDDSEPTEEERFYQYSEQCENEFIYASKLEWLDILLDLIKTTPQDILEDKYNIKESWELKVELFAAYIVTKFGPDALPRIQSLLGDLEHRRFGIAILGTCELPEALNLLQPFVEDLPSVTFEEFNALIESVVQIGGQRGRAMLEQIREAAPEEWLERKELYCGHSTIRATIQEYLDGSWREGGYLYQKVRFLQPGFTDR